MDAFSALSQCTPPSESTEDFGLLSPCTPVAGCDEVPLTPDAVRMAPRTPDFDAAPRTPESFVMSLCTPCAVVPDVDGPLSQVSTYALTLLLVFRLELRLLATSSKFDWYLFSGE